MDCEMEDLEFDLDNVVDDVEMSDDELDRELKEIEKENENKLLQEKSNDRLKDLSDDKEKKSSNDRKRHRSKPKVPEIYNELESSGRHSRYDHRDNQGYSSKSKHQVCEIYREKMFDYRRLNKSLHVTKSSDPMIIGREIAYRLQEPKTNLFGHVVRVLGFTMTSEIFAETKEIVNRGGMKTDSGDRLRSPGGTFLYVMKNRWYATPEQVKEIFKEENEAKKQHRKKKVQQQREAEKLEKEKFDQKLQKEKNQTSDCKIKINNADKKDRERNLVKMDRQQVAKSPIKTYEKVSKLLHQGQSCSSDKSAKDEILEFGELSNKPAKEEELEDGELLLSPERSSVDTVT